MRAVLAVLPLAALTLAAAPALAAPLTLDFQGGVGALGGAGTDVEEGFVIEALGLFEGRAASRRGWASSPTPSPATTR